MNRLFPLAALLLALSACSPPADVAVQFHDALYRGDGAKAFSLLSKPTQDQLSAIAKKAHDMSGGTVPNDPTMMIVHGDSSLYPAPTSKQKVVRASTLSSEGPHAKVKVRIGETDHEMDLVKENGRWRIDLPISKP
ncbi:MAG: DUF4878 domain-containing protein [Myxococcales bacterium]